MTPRLNKLQKLLELSQLSATRFITVSKPLAPPGAKATFGGTLVAQSLLASLYTVPANFHPSSLHCYFLIGGDPQASIQYDVQSLRQGRNFIHREIKAYQHDRLIFCSTALFYRVKSLTHDSLHHVKKVASLPPQSEYEVAHRLFEKEVVGNLERYSRINPTLSDRSNLKDFVDRFEKGVVDYRFPRDMFHSKHATDTLNYYLRVRDPIAPETDPRYNYVALAYFSDSYLLLTLPYFHQLPLYSHKFSVSLDHTVYFHKLPKVNDWMFLEMQNPRSASDKHLIQGEFYEVASKEIVASVSQEGLVVYPPEEEIRSKF